MASIFEHFVKGISSLLKGKKFRPRKKKKLSRKRKISRHSSKRPKALKKKVTRKKVSSLPRKARTRFVKKATAAKESPRRKPKVALKRVTRVQLVCPEQRFFDNFLRLLVEARCPVEANREKLLLSYSTANEPEVSNAIRTLRTQYRIKIEDVA